MTPFCREVCGTCPQCVQATLEHDALEAIYETLSEDDLSSLLRQDPDDPRTFALDHKGRP